MRFTASCYGIWLSHHDHARDRVWDRKLCDARRQLRIPSARTRSVLRQAAICRRVRHSSVRRRRCGPNSAIVPGVARVQTRIVEPAMLPLANVPEPIRARIVSLPDAPSRARAPTTTAPAWLPCELVGACLTGDGAGGMLVPAVVLVAGRDRNKCFAHGAQARRAVTTGACIGTGSLGGLGEPLLQAAVTRVSRIVLVISRSGAASIEAGTFPGGNSMITFSERAVPRLAARS